MGFPLHKPHIYSLYRWLPPFLVPTKCLVKTPRNLEQRVMKTAKFYPVTAWGLHFYHYILIDFGWFAAFGHDIHPTILDHPKPPPEARELIPFRSEHTWKQPTSVRPSRVNRLHQLHPLHWTNQPINQSNPWNVCVFHAHGTLQTLLSCP